MFKWVILAGSAGVLIGCQAVPMQSTLQEGAVKSDKRVTSVQTGSSKTGLEGATIIALAHEAAPEIELIRRRRFS